jgi:hypothetical protein
MASPEDPYDLLDPPDLFTDVPTNGTLVVRPARTARYRYLDPDDVDYEDRPTGLSPARRWMLIIVTLIVITALVATTILPGLLAARYNNARQMLPSPTVLPRI